MRSGPLVLTVAVVAWIAGLSAWVANDPKVAETAYPPFSTYNTSPGGLSQLYGYLAARRGDVAVGRVTTMAQWDRLASQSTVFRIGSRLEPVSIQIEKRAKRVERKKAERVKELRKVTALLGDAEESWVRRGGRLVVAPSAATGDVSLEPVQCEAYTAVFPLDPALPAPALPFCKGLSGAGLRRFHSLMLNGSSPVVVRARIGNGEVVMVSLPELFSNEMIAERPNLEIAERLAGNSRHVFFDETVHGIDVDRSLAGLLVAEWRLGPTVSVLVLAGILAFWRNARHPGRPDRIAGETRSEAVDLVDSLGRLYDRALDREESLRRYFHAIVRASHARTGLTGEPLDRYVRANTAGYDPSLRFHDISHDEFQRLLQVLNRAYEMVTHANTR